jgi:uroporphyrinogen decarboxylase
MTQEGIDMDSRSLIHNLLTRRGAIERVGLYEHFWPELDQLWGKEAGVAQLAAEFDMRGCGGWFNNEAIEGTSEIVEESPEWVVKRNGSGASLRWWKHKSGTPEHIEFRMTSRALWEQEYRPHIPTMGKFSRLEGGPWKGSGTIADDRSTLALARSAGQWAFYGHVFIWETLRQSLGDLALFENMALDPGWIRDFNRVYTDFYKAQFRLLFDTLGLPDGIWIYEDLGYRNGLFASPRAYGELIIPFFAELVDFFHAQGLPVVLHSCGNVTEALPLIVDAGFDALQPMEVKAGCDPFAFAERYRDRLAFIGGLDVRFLETNDRTIIRREVARLIEGMKARGARYIFHSDHSVTPLVTLDSYRYALDVYHEHRMY